MSRSDINHRRIAVLYDGFCPVCRRSAVIIRKFDLLGAITLKKFQDFPLDSLPVPLDKLGERVHACSMDYGECRDGIHAFTSILLRIPPLFPLAALSFLLGLIPFGQDLYDFISRNRYNLPFSGMTSRFSRR